MRISFFLLFEYIGWCIGLFFRLELLNKDIKFEMFLRRFFVKDLFWWMFINYIKICVVVVMLYIWFNGVNWVNSKGCWSWYEKNFYLLLMC